MVTAGAAQDDQEMTMTAPGGGGTRFVLVSGRLPLILCRQGQEVKPGSPISGATSLPFEVLAEGSLGAGQAFLQAPQEGAGAGAGGCSYAR